MFPVISCIIYHLPWYWLFFTCNLQCCIYSFFVILPVIIVIGVNSGQISGKEGWGKHSYSMFIKRQILNWYVKENLAHILLKIYLFALLWISISRCGFLRRVAICYCSFSFLFKKNNKIILTRYCSNCSYWMKKINRQLITLKMLLYWWYIDIKCSAFIICTCIY